MSTILNTRKKHTAPCYHEDLNGIGKPSSVLTRRQSDLRGLVVKAMILQPKGREFESRCGQDVFSFCKSRLRSLQQGEAQANEINHDIHLANTLFQIKVRQKKIWLPSIVVYHCSC